MSCPSLLTLSLPGVPMNILYATEVSLCILRIEDIVYLNSILAYLASTYKFIAEWSAFLYQSI